MTFRRSIWLGLTATFLALACSAGAQLSQNAQSLLSARARDRVLRAVDDQERVVLRGDRHPLASAENEVGSVSPDYRMERMVLTLKPDPAQQSALDALLVAQHDPASPYYHQWLTPQTYGERFGVSENDLAQVMNWLQIHRLYVEEITPSRRAIVFSGTAAQVQSAFHAPIRTYKVGGEVHHANASNPEIPNALYAVVGGVLSLHDFRSQPMHSGLRQTAPEFTSGSSHYITPADFSAIYDIDPLYQQGISGTGQTIAIVGRSNINLADVRQFRSSFGLPANDPQLVLNGANPGILNSGEEAEALLDVEWSGAVARDAKIKFVVSASTSSSDGVFLSSQYIVNHNVAPVMSVSFGLCEAALGASGNSFFNSLWQQAAAQGITVFVSSGDSGAAGCDSPSAARATKGKGINGLCSSPYSVCVGGTQFDDASNASLYWSSSNVPGSLASALSYIPETAWNESTTWGLWSTGGGPSSIYAKPGWQAGLGVPADGKRDTPDVAFTAAGHDGYLVTMHGGLAILSGTSAASPSWAGLMALVVQNAATRQGNANPAFYSLAAKQRAGGPAVFHDVVAGSNAVPGVAGFAAGNGYDLATGLGSVDGSVLVTSWKDALVKPGIQLSLASATLSIPAGSAADLSLTTAVSGGFNSAIQLAVTGLPSGMTVQFDPGTISAPGAGQSTLTFASSSAVKPGSYAVVLSATGGGITQRANVTVSVPGFTLVAGVPSAGLAKNKTVTVKMTTKVLAGFRSPVALSVSGLPTGVTATFSPQSIAAPGAGVSTLTLKRGSAGTAGSVRLTVTAVGGGVTKTALVTITMK